MVSIEFPPLLYGGISTFTHDLANGLANRQHDIHVFCGETRKRDKNLNSQLSIYRIPFLHRMVPLNLLSFGFIFLMYQKLFGTFKKLNVDIVHIQSPCAFPFALLLSGKPIIVTFHSNSIDEMIKFLRAPFKTWTPIEFVGNVLLFPYWWFNDKIGAHYASYVTCVSRNVREYLIRFLGVKPEKIFITPPGVEINSECNFNSQGHSVMYLGRLSWRKGIDTLVNAMAVVKDQIPEVRLYIIGGGPLKKYISKLVQKVCPKAIKLVDKVSDQKLKNYFKKMAVQVVPSTYEPFGITVLEGASKKMCVITSDIDSFKEIVCDKSFHFRVGDSIDLSKKIIYVLKKKEIRRKLSEDLYNHVFLNYNKEKIAAGFEKIYLKAIK